MTSAQRPAIETITEYLHSVFAGRKFEGLQIHKVEYVFFPSTYNMSISWDNRNLVLKLPSELVEDALAKNDLMNKRKIKRMVTKALGINADSDD